MIRTSCSLLLALALAGCCSGGAAPSPAPTTPPSTVPPVVTPAAASGPGTAGCPDPGAAVVGTWTREGLTEEYREDGTYLLNGRQGTYRWLSPGRAVIEIPEASLTGEFHIGLADPSTLIVVDSEGAGSVYTRSSPPPTITPACLDLSTAFVGDWAPRGGGTVELYRADGTYQVAGSGRWSFPSPGLLQLTREDGLTSQYRVAMPARDVALAVSLPPLAPAGVVYQRRP